MKFSTFQKKRVVMATIGSLGDLHPYIALALEMKKRYIEPVIATSNTYRERVESLNIEFHPIRPAMPAQGSAEYQRWMDGVIDPNRGAEFLFKQILVPAVRDMYEDLSVAIQGADLLVTHPIVLAGPPLAQKTGIPWVSTALAPASRGGGRDRSAGSPPSRKTRALEAERSMTTRAPARSDTGWDGVPHRVRLGGGASARHPDQHERAGGADERLAGAREGLAEGVQRGQVRGPAPAALLQMPEEGVRHQRQLGMQPAGGGAGAPGEDRHLPLDGLHGLGCFAISTCASRRQGPSATTRWPRPACSTTTTSRSVSSRSRSIAGRSPPPRRSLFAR